jgi:hypothetical protein
VKRLAQVIGVAFVAGVLVPGAVAQVIAAYKIRRIQSESRRLS